MEYTIKRVIVGPIQTNCYIVVCSSTREGFIIDPGDEFEKIRESLPPEAEIQFIVNTHCHIDHIKEDARFRLPVYIHPLDRECLVEPAKNLSAMLEEPVSMNLEEIRTIEDGDTINIGKLTVRVLHTPGHSPGSICLKMPDGTVFTGDTLFCDGWGRTDLPGGSEKVIFRSIREKLLVMDDSTRIYPGHGPSSSIGEQKHYFQS